MESMSVRGRMRGAKGAWFDWYSSELDASVDSGDSEYISDEEEGMITSCRASGGREMSLEWEELSSYEPEVRGNVSGRMKHIREGESLGGKETVGSYAE